MTVEQEVANLTTAVDNLTDTVNVSKATLDAKVSDATEQAGLAATHKVGAEQARDAAEGHKNAAYGYAQDAASAIVYQNLAGVLASYNLNIVDAFVYDTTRDWLNGLWRYQCQGKSWFDEEGAATGRWLGSFATSGDARAAGGVTGDYYLASSGAKQFLMLTDAGFVEVTRGSRKESPAVQKITAEAGRVVIWDGDDPSLPMWMVFKGSGGNFIEYAGAGVEVSCVKAVNGQLLVGTDKVNAQGLRVINFLSDKAHAHREGVTYQGIRGNIAQRNDGLGVYSDGSYGTIVHRTVNDVAMTVLPGAPIDPDTGMPIPTIAVATDGGVSVIRDDGRVVDVATSGAVASVSIGSDGGLLAVMQTGVVYFWKNIGSILADGAAPDETISGAIGTPQICEAA